MRALVSTLIELQDREILLEESQIVHRTDQPAELDDVRSRIQELRAQIPERYLKRYEGHRRGGLGAVREVGGSCRGCFLNVPIGDLNRMRRGQMPWVCPNCGRFLLLSEDS